MNRGCPALGDIVLVIEAASSPFTEESSENGICAGPNQELKIIIELKATVKTLGEDDGG